MDHLPQIGSSTTIAPHVPYLCEKEPYDNLGFSTYPKRRGWNFDGPINLLPVDLVPKPASEIGSFLQSWLYFGMIVEVLGISGITVNCEDFVKEINGRKLITTARLPTYVDKWFAKERNYSRAVQVDHSKRAYDCLKQASDFVGGALSLKSPNSSAFPLSLEVSLSIQILGQSLENARVHLWPLDIRMMVDHNNQNIIVRSRQSLAEGSEFFKEEYPSEQLFLYTPLLTTKYMQDAGWCRSEIYSMEKQLSSTDLYLMSILDRPAMKTNHSAFDCGERECKANQILDVSKYQPRHSSLCNGCTPIRIESDKVAAVLEKGRIPALKVESLDGNGSVRVVVVDAGPRNYVAISHVWSHGLGSPQGNELPRCQVLRIASLAAALYEPAKVRSRRAVHVWIDSLCIPREISARKRGIRLLKKTFEEADKVLVLDVELEAASYKVSNQELLSRILSSGWLRRLWTLQEALLATIQLYIQFQGRAIDLFPLLKEFWEENLRNPNIYCSAGRSLAIALRTVLPISSDKFESKSTHRDLEVLALALEYRTTSVAEDEFICIGAMLGIDVKRLLDVQGEGRVSLFYSMLSDKTGLPIALLFIEGPRLQQPGYRWAPSTLMKMDMPDLLTLNVPFPPAQCNEKGIYVHIGGWELSGISSISTEIIAFKDPQDQCWCTIEHFERTSGKSWKHLGLDQRYRPAIVFNPFFVNRGLLVSIRNDLGAKDHDIYHAKFLWLVDVTIYQIGEKPGIVQLYEFRNSHRKELKMEALNYEVIIERIKSQQRWCIG